MEVTIPLSTRDEALALFGLSDRNLKILRDRLGVKISARNDVVKLEGDPDPLGAAERILLDVLAKHRDGAAVPDDYVENSVRNVLRTLDASSAASHGAPGARDLPSDGPGSGTAAGAAAVRAAEEGTAQAATRGPEGDRGPGEGRGESGRSRLSKAELSFIEGLARSEGQARYLEDMFRQELVFCLGPAGTGKTFLAVNVAVQFLKEGAVNRLILCRPAVEAGEKLGFLPGDFHAKINPYLRPLYDALNDVLGYEQVKRYEEREIIEIIPLAYMRGRTLNNAFIILDEGQNTTPSQMKMFLTRMGSHSRIVVNGDETQVDLPKGQPSGLIEARRVIQDVPGIAWCRLGRPDIVRHRLVQRIVEAYEAHASASGGTGTPGEPGSSGDAPRRRGASGRASE